MAIKESDPSERARVRKSIGTSNTSLRTKVTHKEKARLIESKKSGDTDLSITEVIQKEILSKSVTAQQFADPFMSLYSLSDNNEGSLQPISPTYNPHLLKRVPLENNILLQCIDAMVLNIEGTGHTWEYVGPDDDANSEESAASQSELNKLKSFVSAPNEEYTMMELRKRVRRDIETFGYGFIEILRDKAGREVFAAYHLPAHSVRLTGCESESVLVDYEIVREEIVVKITRQKNYRRFIQQNGVGIAGKNVWFKEYGDTRIIDCKSGQVEDASHPVPLKDQANEVLMISSYKSGHLYGYPRWINQLPSILGSRESELVNVEFFKDNAIPALAILVAGGYLSEDTVDAISDKFNSKRGREKMNEVLILEAVGDEDAASIEKQIPVPKIDIRPLAGERPQDALFQDYDANCRIKIRSAFRLPPIILGISDDYTRATADASIIVVESQVFQPEREDIDLMINKKLLSDGVNLPRFWRYKSNPTRIVDDKDIATSIDKLEKSGALTPNVAIHLANKMFGTDIKPTDEVWGDYPFSMTIELIKKKGMSVNGIERLVKEIQSEIGTDTKLGPVSYTL